MSDLYRIIMIILLICIVWINYRYIQIGWCESEIDIIRLQLDEIHTSLIKD